ncbi:MAG TPA: alkaline phosphatase PhoX [Chitinophagales bacterium]|nr:alkaline phosphatase PhoX [Chitinophagales bacterium]
MKYIFFITCLVFITSCKTDKKTAAKLFEPVAINYNNHTVTLPKGFTYKILFSESDTVVTNAGVRALAKGSQDMIVYIPIKNSSEHGLLYVNHEEHKPNALLGDGGGGTVFEVKKVKGEWQVLGDYRAVDFSAVGETFRNCGGTLTPYGTILTTEEEFPLSNTEINTRFGITDTSDFEGEKKPLNYGWIVEVDPVNAKALRKIKSFGRYRHEDVQCMPDKKTVYLTHDDKPSVLFKFVAEKENDYSKGQLYAYQQSSDAQSGSWLALPMNDDSLMDIVNVSLRLGATMFISTEWIEAAGDKLYISESGSRKFNFDEEIALGAKPAKHLIDLCKKGSNNYEDPYGRILELDMQTNKMRVLLNGGISAKDSMFCFASPDAMNVATINGKKYLVISEDSQGYLNGKAGAEIDARKEVYNEVYFLDLSIAEPKLEDLQRFMMAPEGCETTGNMFTPDGKTYFVSIQHPSATNPAPFNKSSVIAVTGF